MNSFSLDLDKKENMFLREIPCMYMRGGTSKGPYFLAKDLPTDEALRDRVLLAVMGSPDIRQIDGLGGATAVTSKVAIVSPSERSDCVLDYLFAQVSVEKDFVDTAPTCGNMMSGVVPFAIERGLIQSENGKTEVVIRNVNTGSLIEILVNTENNRVVYGGDTAIAGVPGTASPIELNFMNIIGTKTGKLLPTSNPRDEIDGIWVSLVDAAVPMVIFKAIDMGIKGNESKEELDNNQELLNRIEKIRLVAGKLMGLGDVSNMVIPKVALVATPLESGNILSRYFVPDSCHPTFAVSGAICLSSAIFIEDSMASDVAKDKGDGLRRSVKIEHPAGTIDVNLFLNKREGFFMPEKAGIIRTARKIFDGHVYIPETVWPTG